MNRHRHLRQALQAACQRHYRDNGRGWVRLSDWVGAQRGRKRAGDILVFGDAIGTITRFTFHTSKEAVDTRTSQAL